MSEPGKDAAQVMRQALAGMLWSKQYYLFEVDKWLEEHGVDPMQQATTRQVRNREWFHMINAHVISMPPPSSNRGSGSGCHSLASGARRRGFVLLRFQRDRDSEYHPASESCASQIGILRC